MQGLEPLALCLELYRPCGPDPSASIYRLSSIVSAAEPLLCFKRRRFPICAPPPSPWPQAIPLAPLRPKGVTPEPPSQSHHHLSAVGSSLLRREPPVESISRFRCRVVRNPIAAKPLISSISYTSPYFLTLSLKRHLERWKNTKCLYSPKSLQLR